jgi:hypothetical protein
MTPEERNLISGLFDRVGQANNQPRDPEADQLIRSKVSEIPAAPYLLVQSLLVMQQAVSNAQSRIATLEKQLAENPAPGTQQGGGSFLAGVASLFGGGQSHGQPQRGTTPPPPPAPAPMQPAQPPPPAYNYPPPASQPSPRAGGGGFLQGALSTAAGVAGGALLFQGIEGLIGHNPGPFSGATTSSGGLFGGGTPVENTEVINNYYDQGGDENRGQSGQSNADQTAYADPDPDPDPATTDDYVSDSTDFGGDDSGGGDDSSYV